MDILKQYKKDLIKTVCNIKDNGICIQFSKYNYSFDKKMDIINFIDDYRNKDKSGTYLILNIFNSKKYIGCTANLKRREKEHFKQLKLNKHQAKELQKDYNKYGREAFLFIIIEKYKENTYKTFERERYFIENSDNNTLYNNKKNYELLKWSL